MSSSPVDYAAARRALARRDPILRDLMRRQGACGLAASQRTDPFQALVHAIISQQLSTRAAATIASRVDALLGGVPTPASLAGVSDAELRTAGLSGRKVSYLRALSAHVGEGSLVLSALDAMADEDVIAALTQIKGVGRWTAEMFLMFRLHRPDVLPVGDLGIGKAVQRAYRLRTFPSPTRLLRLGESWRPYRSVACWYLWASLSNTPAQE